MAAAGQLLQINQYQALYSLIGNTYGGMRTANNFALPDLRGRVVVGVGTGPGLPPVNYGTMAGSATTLLTPANLPAHSHALSTANVKVQTTAGNMSANASIGSLTVNTTAGTLAVSTTAGNLAASSTLTGLTATLNASTGLAAVTSPAGAALPNYSGLTKFYANVTPPNVTMAPGSVSIAGGTVTTTLSGSPTSTLTGSPASTLSGAPAISFTGGPTVVVTGVTDVTPTTTTQPAVTMPPFTALVYYIATGGIYPTPD